MARDLLDLFSMKNWRFSSWSLAATIASALVLVSVVHLFLFPLTPSFNYFKLASDSCISTNASAELISKHGWDEPAINLKHQFPADLHGSVAYKGAPWKAEMGRWLAGCDSITKEVNISEIIGGNNCKNDCSGQGVCNRELGQCRCFHGYAGDGCTNRLELECNFPASPEAPFGRWVVSICPANCDKTRAMCFCGEGTKYPSRPLAETCGFQFNPPLEPDGPKIVNWTKVDQDVFTTNGSIQGWCNVDPTEAYAGKIKFKEECDCKYDGLWGRFCEVPVESVCINQCSGHGHCRGGFCQCDNGWYGADCSTPSVISSIRDWPSWLRPARVDVPDSEKLINLNAVVAKKRPLIYIYDLPPEYNSLLLEGRHFKLECVNRIYDDNNSTIWTEHLYGAQMAIYESLLASPHRTLNGEEADFFFVPVLDSCIITRADDAPHLSMQRHQGLRSSLTLEYYKNAYYHIVEQYPYWNRSSGRDHIWFFSWDEGACYAPKEIWNSMMLVHWGNTNSKHNHSTTAYWADNWDKISTQIRGIHPCFDPDKDLVLPAWKVPDANVLASKFWAWPREKRKTLFFFNGNLGPAYPHGRPEDSYSMGIRQKLAEEFASSPNKDGKLGKQYAEDVTVTPVRSDHYHADIASSIFCGVLPGDGWSGRMEDSVLQGCIPVVIQDGIFLPYENVLNYDSFAVRISEDEIPNMIKILRGFNDTEINLKLANVQKIWQRFLYRDSILLEAERQKSAFGHVDDWAVEFLKLTEDDVTTTLIQVLYYQGRFMQSGLDWGLKERNALRTDELGLEIMQISVPTIMALAADPIASLIDTAFIGHIGPVELAAVGVSIAFFNQVSKIAIIPLVSVTTSLVAEEDATDKLQQTQPSIKEMLIKASSVIEEIQLEVEENIEQSADPECSTSSTNIDRVVKFGHEKSYIPSASSAIGIGGVLGVLQTLFIIFTAKSVLNYMGIHSNSPMLKPAQQYLILRSFGAPAVILSMAIQGIFRGIKDTRTPLYATIIGDVTNIILDPLLMFAFRLGVSGAAIAHIISQYLISLILLWSLMKQVVLLPPSFQDFQFQKILKNGFLLLVKVTAATFCVTLSASLAARQGSTTMAAFQICLQIWMVTSLLADGLAVAGQAIIASAFARRDYNMVIASASRVLQLGLILGLLLSFLLFSLLPFASRLFTNDINVLQVIGIGIPYVAATQPINALAFVFDGVNYGVSDFIYSAYSMLMVASVSILCLYTLSSSLGFTGIWIALSIYMSLRIFAGFWRIGTGSGPWSFLKDNYAQL